MWLVVLRGRPGGQWSGRLRSPNGAAFRDIDNDGDLDLYVTVTADEQDPVNGRFFLFMNDGEGRFTEEAVARGVAVESPQIHGGYTLIMGDYDRDGWIDLESQLSDLALEHERKTRSRRVY